MMDSIKLTKVIAEAIKDDKTLNDNHYVSDINGDKVMFNPFNLTPCLAIMRKISEGDRKEFTVIVQDDSEIDKKNRVKVIYRKNLKMSEGKVAAQVAHAVKNLGPVNTYCDIIVLKVSDKKFFEMIDENKIPFNISIQYDKGLTEVEPNTPTAAAWIELK